MRRSDGVRRSELTALLGRLTPLSEPWRWWSVKLRRCLRPGPEQGSCEADRLRFLPSFCPIAMTTPLISRAGTKQGSQPGLGSIHTHTDNHTYLGRNHSPRTQRCCRNIETVLLKRPPWPHLQKPLYLYQVTRLINDVTSDHLLIQLVGGSSTWKHQTSSPHLLLFYSFLQLYSFYFPLCFVLFATNPVQTRPAEDVLNSDPKLRQQRELETLNQSFFERVKGSPLHLLLLNLSRRPVQSLSAPFNR